MLSIVFMSLIGGLVLAGMFDSNGSEPADEDQVVDDIEDGQVIETGGGNDTVQNTSGAAVSDVNILTFGGNDTVSGKFEDSSISTGDGNDIVTGEYWDADISTGIGDDHITVTGSGVEIRAGDGDDTIDVTEVDLGPTVYGGAGNDVIDARGTTTAIIEGEEGDDQIIIDDLNYASEGFTVSGGAGADTFDAAVTLDDSYYDPSAGSRGLFQIDDFVHGEDTLSITVQEENLTLDIVGRSVFEDMSVVSSGSGSVVHLNFRIIADDPAIPDTFQVLSIGLGAAGVTADDINVLTWSELRRAENPASCPCGLLADPEPASFARLSSSFSRLPFR